MSNLSYSMDATGRLKLNSPFDPTKESRQYREWAHKQLSSCLTPTSPVQDYSSSDTWIFPTLQMGVFNIRHDEHMVSYLLENAAPGSTLTIASPYLNLAANYKKLILSGHGNVDIVTASPKVGHKIYTPLMSIQGQWILRRQRHLQVRSCCVLCRGT